LKQVGAIAELLQARSVEELRRIVLNLNSAEITLAIRDALHPANGNREKHFEGLREGGLKKVLKNRFNDLKAYREKELRRGAGGQQQQHDWMDDLIRKSDGTVATNLANLILILRKAADWQDVLAFDEFNQRVVLRKRPP
jgi:hypothetical protein